ncbi:hypothetical protein BDA99DRAFT_518479 [Phascolomyces articulosus]|uniref:Uncharacterized protein n=1 Tax=Phascolomyces articulosus TaxID=60185 RepID=A0AAD5K490_9FUNG|nr:hypothetical protein BDA99DRAFT_518479 [Phascolomyces articulosus]
MICLCSSSNNNRSTTTTKATPRTVGHHYSYSHKMNIAQVRQGQNQVKQYYDEQDTIIDRAPPPVQQRQRRLHKRHDQQQLGDPKLEVLAPQPKKSLRRSFKLHMQSIKLSFNQVVRRSATRFHKNKKHPHSICMDDEEEDESIVIHPLDLGKTQSSSSSSSACSITSTSTSCSSEIRRKSFSNYNNTAIKNHHLIFNPFRRKTAPEIVIHNFNITNKKKKKKL